MAGVAGISLAAAENVACLAGQVKWRRPAGWRRLSLGAASRRLGVGVQPSQRLTLAAASAAG